MVAMGVGVRVIAPEHACLQPLFCCRPFCVGTAEVVNMMRECADVADGENLRKK